METKKGKNWKDYIFWVFFLPFLKKNRNYRREDIFKSILLLIGGWPESLYILSEIQKLRQV